MKSDRYFVLSAAIAARSRRSGSFLSALAAKSIIVGTCGLRRWN